MIRFALVAAPLIMTVLLHAGIVRAQTKVVVGISQSEQSLIGRAAGVLKDRAAQYSGGDLRVEVYPNSQLGNFGVMVTQMKVNLVNLVFIQPDALGEQAQIATANSWPFLFSNQDEMMAAWKGPGGQNLIAEVEKRSGYRMLAPAWNEPRWIFVNVPAKSLADLKGLKLRVPGTRIYVSQIQRLGLNPTPLNVAELYTGMQQNVVNGAEFTLSDADGFSLQEVTKTVVRTGHVLSPKVWLSWGKWIDGLSPKNKESLLKALADASDAYGKAYQAEADKLVQKFQAKGVSFIDPGVARDQLRQMTEPMKAELPEIWTWAQRLAENK